MYVKCIAPNKYTYKRGGFHMNEITMNENDNVQPKGLLCGLVCTGIGAGCSALLCAAGGDGAKITLSWIGVGSGSFSGVTAIAPL